MSTLPPWVTEDIDGRTFRQHFIDMIEAERKRQDDKWGWVGSEGTILPGDDPHAKVSVLLEEVGEVAKALLEDDQPGLDEELIQVAAVCLAWLEARAEGKP